MFAMVSDMQKLSKISIALCCVALFSSELSMAQTGLTSVPIKNSALLELQVMSTTVVVNELPDRTSTIIANVARGNTLNVLEQRG